ncbi:hypothetical protein CHLRE_02g090400v5 [Chlamydomonas reinhardtii]|uniref:Uncharacterized protein n=1 Tax=Chlamydomonas reinhardtii TaxID=3055 RepID=A0A2K3E183_CHLRE|nr:uncharacterized protein CHLRE_02g090400v5 [Chlamydomonas reinhardtii]PNW86529.1 hypothetical protein CHLRE_02g090400v5 [Chlamydomonas reinhardtii]
MAKGIAQRRRLKRALNAAQGNLHRIQNGKAIPKIGLPEAPQPGDTEKLPASLRRMLALKEAAEKQRQGKGGGQQQQQEATQGGAQGRSKKQRQQQKQKPDGDGDSGDDSAGDDGPSTSGRDVAEPQAGAAAGKQQPGGKMKGGNAFLLNESQFASKKLKDRKKEYLKRKKEKKAVKTASGAPLVEKELQLRDKVKFGEVVDAPLEIHLKRKHWADKERTAADRCKDIFVKQMEQAQQRMAAQAGAGAAADGGLAVGAAAGAGAAGKGKGKAGGAAAAAAAAAAGKKRKAPMDEQTEALRLHAIEAYRASKRGGGGGGGDFHGAAVGNATMASLARLAGRGAGGAGAGAGGGGGGAVMDGGGGGSGGSKGKKGGKGAAGTFTLG